MYINFLFGIIKKVKDLKIFLQVFLSGNCFLVASASAVVATAAAVVTKSVVTAAE